ncbi:hypothetical protein AVEN_38861-1 [Araneus ventricosus]|uniref:Uncharacterized protein n=1 Tax=Araneus ventricosus TaxID=182803 RepID=A0A4Y2NW30_ARAVE|nr:hypothetical protein AVEN_38861-1 [Araneus ventricosus]
MQKEEYEEWMPIDEDIPADTTLTDLEICQAVYEQDQAIKIDDSDGHECVAENPPTNAEMRQALDILKRGVQHRSANVKKQYEYYNIRKAEPVDKSSGFENLTCIDARYLRIVRLGSQRADVLVTSDWEQAFRPSVM